VSEKKRERWVGWVLYWSRAMAVILPALLFLVFALDWWPERRTYTYEQHFLNGIVVEIPPNMKLFKLPDVEGGFVRYRLSQHYFQTNTAIKASTRSPRIAAFIEKAWRLDIHDHAEHELGIEVQEEPKWYEFGEGRFYGGYVNYEKVRLLDGFYYRDGLVLRLRFYLPEEDNPNFSSTFQGLTEVVERIRPL
jgi:hypothetical protein